MTLRLRKYRDDAFAQSWLICIAAIVALAFSSSPILAQSSESSSENTPLSAWLSGSVELLPDKNPKAADEVGTERLVPAAYESPASLRDDTDFGPQHPTIKPFDDEPPSDSWQLLPDGLLYKSYLAGTKEPRISSAWLYDMNGGWIWDATLGGRAGIVRYGTRGAVDPEGWQLDVEGAGFPRLDIRQQEDLISSDFRFGVPVTWSRGPFSVKTGYYHISSHVGDEFLLRNPGIARINYVRDAIVLAGAYEPTANSRLYAETAFAFHYSVAEPWEFQFGYEFSPKSKRPGNPFWAINAQLFEELEFGGNVNIVGGWQWRGPESDRLFRIGIQYFNGSSSQLSFYNQYEELLGAGMWLDY